MIHTRPDSILPRLPKDDSPAEQRQFNESLLKIIRKLSTTANADIQRLTNDIESLVERVTTLEEI